MLSRTSTRCFPCNRARLTNRHLTRQLNTARRVTLLGCLTGRSHSREGDPTPLVGQPAFGSASPILADPPRLWPAQRERRAASQQGPACPFPDAAHDDHRHNERSPSRVSQRSIDCRDFIYRARCERWRRCQLCVLWVRTSSSPRSSLQADFVSYGKVRKLPKIQRGPSLS